MHEMAHRRPHRRAGELFPALLLAAIIGCHLTGGEIARIGVPVLAAVALITLIVRWFIRITPSADSDLPEPLIRQIARRRVEDSPEGPGLSTLGSSFSKQQWHEAETAVDSLLDNAINLIRLHLDPHTVAVFFPAPDHGFAMRRHWSRSSLIDPAALITSGRGVLGALLKNDPAPVSIGEIMSDSTTLFYYGKDAGVRSLIACPIVTGSAARGLLLADSTTPHAFEKRHADFLAAMGDLLGSAVFSAYLATQHEIEHRRLAAVSDIEKEFFRHDTVDAILDILTGIVPFFAACDRLTLSTRMDDGESALLRRIYGVHTAGLLRTRFSLVKKNLAGVLYAKNLCFSRNFASDRYEVRYFDQEPKNSGFGSFLALPLGIAECRGLILLESFRPDAFPETLVRPLSRIATSASLAMERIALLESATSLATHDSLTGLANHRQFLQLIKDEVVRSKRFNDPLTVVLCDIDFFKKVNDTWGHPFGNTVLKGLGALLEESIRQRVDTAARYGGEEFALILVKTDLTQAKETAERIRARIAASPYTSPTGKEVRLTMSFGLAVLGPEIADVDELIGQADKALYRAKELGRNRVEVF
jgi:diguanylate cyclase (GGDEF)-like protein